MKIYTIDPSVFAELEDADDVDRECENLSTMGLICVVYDGADAWIWPREDTPG